VHAPLVEKSEDWEWSSTRALTVEESNHLLIASPTVEKVGHHAVFL
jgi:hypothetical protein